MKKRKPIGLPRFAPIYRNEEGGEGGGGNSGTTFTQEQLEDAVSKAVEDATGGLKGKNSELMGKLKEAQGNLKNWEGLEPDKVRGLLSQLENDEVLKLHAEGKHDEAYNKRMEKERSEWQSKLEGVETTATTEKERAEKLEVQVRDLLINQQVTTNFIAEKGFEHAVTDAILRAKSEFNIEDGVAIARDEKGEIIRGANGPITIPEWIEARKKDCPHWFPGSKGAGAEGGGAGGSGSEIDDLMEAAASSGDMDEYRRLKTLKKEQAGKKSA